MEGTLKCKTQPKKNQACETKKRMVQQKRKQNIMNLGDGIVKKEI